jgi:hypothetical protein
LPAEFAGSLAVAGAGAVIVGVGIKAAYGIAANASAGAYLGPIGLIAFGVLTVGKTGINIYELSWKMEAVKAQRNWAEKEYEICKANCTGSKI